MARQSRTLLLVAALLVAGMFVTLAQSDLSGHWEGSVQAPETTIDFHIDVTRDASGNDIGTIGLPGERLHGLPLTTIAIDGAVRFSARSEQTFAGGLSPDGQSISGQFTMKEGSAPFRLSRAGEAQIAPRPTSPRISERLAGSWTATLEGPKRQVRVRLTLENRPDGRASGSLVNLDDGGLELPLTIDESTEAVTLRTTPLDSSFSGVLNAEGTVLDGTYCQGTQSVALTFRRVAR
jgi:hypothetical protein